MKRKGHHIVPLSFSLACAQGNRLGFRASVLLLRENVCDTTRIGTESRGDQMLLMAIKMHEPNCHSFVEGKSAALHSYLVKFMLHFVDLHWEEDPFVVCMARQLALPRRL